jgi:hypothetical protein
LFLGDGGFENKLEIEGKGRIVLALVDDIEDVVFVLEEMFNEKSRGNKGFSVENRSVHGGKGFGCEESCLA